MKRALRYALILLLASTATQAAQTETFIDKEQKRIDNFDLSQDGQVSFKSEEVSKRATELYIHTVDSLENFIVNGGFSDYNQKVYNTNLYLLLTKIDFGNYNNLDKYERIFAHLLQCLDAQRNGNLEDQLFRHPLLTLEIAAFFKYEEATKNFLLATAKLHPDEVLKAHEQFMDQPYSEPVVIAVAHVAPHAIKKYFTANSTINSVIMKSSDPVATTLLSIFKKFGASTKAFTLVDAIVNHKMTIAQADSIGKDDRAYLNTMMTIRSKPDCIGAMTLDQELEIVSLKYIRVVNDLHDETNPLIRFKVVNDFSPEELYTTMVYTQEEIFTSTFMGMFDRLMDKMAPMTGDELLTEMGLNRFRGFLKMCAGYNTLNEFLGTMSYSAKDKLLVAFASDLEATKGDLSAAVDVADTYGSIDDMEALGIIETTIKSEYQRVSEAGNREGIAIYGLLSSFFVDQVMYDENWFSQLTDDYQLPAIDRVPNTKLLNEEGRNIQLHFFYDDKDGEGSFNTFMGYWRDGNWNISDKGTYVIISSKTGTPVEIYANYPKDEYAGHKAMLKDLEEAGKYPTVVVHRGHSYYVPLTIEKIPASAKIVLLGSCGGYHNLTSVLERSDNVQIISSKQIGTMLVNNPLLKQLANDIRQGEDIVWADFWDELEASVKGNSYAFGKFKEYIPPHKNLGAIFIQAYHNLVDG